MRSSTRRILDRSFTAVAGLSVALAVLALAVLLMPIVIRGLGAMVFRATVEHHRLMLEQFHRGDPGWVQAELEQADRARRPVYEWLMRFEEELPLLSAPQRGRCAAALAELKAALRELLGPLPGDERPALLRRQYGQTRWDQALVKLKQVLYLEQWDYSDPARMGTRVYVPRVKQFEGTSLEPLFTYLAHHAADMLRPRWTIYLGFLLDNPLDAHMFGGIWPELLGTFYLTLGAILFAVPIGMVSAAYLAECARGGWLVGLLRSCITTLAGVPSIVFGLFGLAFFINTLHVSPSKSVLAGSLTLAVLILPLIIRSAEEAIRAVPQTYREAALSMGASRWRAAVTVTLPAALPGILTGIVISMGRAAGETAPIIFTAAVSVGPALRLSQTLTQGTPALPWNIYNLCTEHQAADQIRHVQYGMVLVLVFLVLLMNAAAIFLRARISRRLAG